MIFGFCFSKNLKIQIVFFQMIHDFEHYFNIYILTSMDQILWNAPKIRCPVMMYWERVCVTSFFNDINYYAWRPY